MADKVTRSCHILDLGGVRTEKLLTVCNFSAQEAEMELPETFAEGAQCLITNMGRKVFDRKIILNPYEAFVLYKK